MAATDVELIKKQLKCETEQIFSTTMGESLSELKLLSLLLAFTNCEEHPEVLAMRLMKHFGSFQFIFKVSHDQLCQIKGVTLEVAVLLTVIGSIYRCTTREYEKKIGTRLKSTGELFKNALEGCIGEELWIAGFDNKHILRKFTRLTRGRSSHVNADMEAISEFVSTYKLYEISLAHNHPVSLEGRGNDSDFHAACTLKNMLESLGIHLREFYAIGDDIVPLI